MRCHFLLYNKFANEALNHLNANTIKQNKKIVVVKLAHVPVVHSYFIQNLHAPFFFSLISLSSSCYNPSFKSLLCTFAACRYSLFHHLLYSLSSLLFFCTPAPSINIPRRSNPEHYCRRSKLFPLPLCEEPWQVDGEQQTPCSADAADSTSR